MCSFAVKRVVWDDKCAPDHGILSDFILFNICKFVSCTINHERFG